MTDADTKLRFDHIEGMIERVEALIKQEISDLKTEQIKDLREANTRLADDQRRLWDRVVELERREVERAGERGGQHKIISAIWAFFIAAAGGAVTWFATWLSAGKPHP